MAERGGRGARRRDCSGWRALGEVSPGRGLLLSMRALHTPPSLARRRSQKVGEVAGNPWAEVAWYFPDSREQFRLLGRLSVVDAATADEKLQKVRRGAWGCGGACGVGRLRCRVQPRKQCVGRPREAGPLWRLPGLALPAR